MTQRIDFAKEAPGGYQAILNLEKYIRGCGLEESLLHLVKMRASQINGCAFCIDMHSKDARAQGETEQRLYGLSAWRETPYYSDRERAALAWTEALTRIADTQDVSDVVYDEVCSHFSNEELANLSFAVTTINTWNRLAISFRTPVGTYQPQSLKSTQRA